MRVRFLLHDVYTREPGGVLTVTFNLAQELAAHHDVEIVSLLRTQERPTGRLPVGVKLRTLADVRPVARAGGLRGRFQAWALRRPSRLMSKKSPRREECSLYSDVQLLRFLRSVREGALVGMQPGMNVAIARFGRRGDCVLVVQDHLPFVKRPKALREDYERYASRLDVFLTLTERDAHHARKQFHGSVPVEVMANATPEYGGESSDQQTKVVVSAGQLKRIKGFDRLISAWSKVVEKHPDWELRVFGDGPLMGELGAQIDELGLADSARLMGYSQRVQDEMAACSIFVLSSRWEGYGMVLVEAMSAGLPVVSFDCPTGPRDIVDHEVSGLLVPNHDIAAMADAITRMIEVGPDRRLEMGAVGRAQAHDRSGSVVVAQWQQLLSTRLAAKHRRRSRVV